MREEAIIECETGIKTQEEVSQNQSVKTTWRWIKRYRDTIGTIKAALRSVLARLGNYESQVTHRGGIVGKYIFRFALFTWHLEGPREFYKNKKEGV